MNSHRSKKNVRKASLAPRLSASTSLKALKSENQKLHRQALLFQQQQKKRGLLESEEKYRVFTEKSPNMIFINQGGRIVYANPKCEKVMGYTRKEFYAPKFNFLTLIHPDDISVVRRNFLKHQKGKEITPYEYKMITKSGEMIYAILTTKLIHYREKQAILGIVTDITERKRTQDMLGDSEKRYRRLFEAAKDGILILNAVTGMIVDVNPYLVEMLGYSHRAFLGKKIWELGFFRDIVASKTHFLRLQREKYIRYKDLPLETADGRKIDVEFVSNVYQVDHHKVIQCNIRDVTWRKRAQEELKQSLSLQRATLESTADGILVVDKSRKIADFNERFLQLWRLSRKVLVSRDDEKFLKSVLIQLKDPKGFLNKVHQLYGHSEKDSFDVLEFKDGRIFERYSHPQWMDGAAVGRVWSFRDVTSRKRTEKALRESEEQFRLVTKQSPNMIFISQGLRVVYANEQCEKVMGYKPRDYLSPRFNFLKLVHPDGVPLARKNFEVHQKGRDVPPCEYWLLKKGGEVIICIVATKLVWYAGKRSVLTIMADITERKRAEEKLRESEERFRTIFESSHDAMMTLEPPSWRFTSANSAMVRMFRAKNEAEFTSYEPWALSPKRQPDGRASAEKAKKMIRTAMQEGSHFFEWTHKRINGEKFPVEVLLTRVKEKEKTFLHATVRDITERKRAEDSLREHRRQLLQIIDTVPHMIFAKDRQGRFLLVNRATAEAYQRKPKDLIGVRRRDIHKNRQEMEEFLKGDRDVLASGKPTLVSNEPFTDGRGNKHVLQTIKIPFKMTGMKDLCILGVSVDVTEQKKVEEFRNDIVKTVSHELRTPLSIEKEGISLLMDGVVGPVNMEQKEILETVMRSINRLARMITSLLDISSIEAGKIELRKEKIILEDLLKDVAFEFRKKFEEKGLEIKLSLPESATAVLADPDKITQVLTNLVENAFKFTEKGVVEISLVVLKDEVECMVRDTGIGIAPENVDKVFEKFQQFSRTAGSGEKGLGLGLSIAREIIGMHGGRIWIKSKLGKGTRVTFSLPLYQKKEG